MQEKQTTLAVEIQARLSKVLGIEEAKNDLERFTDSIKEQPNTKDIFEQARQTDLYQDNLNQSGITELRQRGIQGYSNILEDDIMRSQANMNEVFVKILKDAETYQGQTIPRRTKEKWDRWITKSIQEAEEAGIDYDKILKNARTQSEKELIEQEQLTADRTKKDFISSLKDQSDLFKDLIENLDKSKESLSGFTDVIKQLGLFAIGGQIAQFGMQYGTLQAQIGARYQTAFDLQSPIGNFSENVQAQLFEKVNDREMLYRGTGGAIGGTVGGILGAIGSLGFGTGIGIAGGAGIGQMIGGFISDLSKTKDEADVKEFLKFLSQTAGIGSSFVEQARGYEIGELSGAVKYGSNFRGRQISGYGITPQEELAYKNMFGDSLRDYDSQLFQEQTLFARRFRLDPNSIYQMNQLTRFTGEEIGTTELNKARSLAYSTYGEEASTERIVDVLRAIKDINMQMLRFDEKADFETSRRIAELPALIMGKDSPYGKIAEMGMDTIGALQGLGQGQDPISQVMLYQAYGETNPINFMRRMQRGFFGQQGNNAQDIFKFLRNLGQIDPFSAEMYLTNMIPNADINEELSSIFTSNDPTQFNKILESLSNGKPIDEALKDVGIKTSRFEINQESIQEQIISSGQKVADTFLSMNEKMIDYQSTIIQSTEAQEQLKKSLEESFKYLDNNLSKWGIIGTDEKIEDNVRSKATEELIKRGLSKDQAKFIADQTAGSNVNQIIENIVKQADSIPQLSDLSIKNLTEELKSYFENQKKYFDESKLNIEIILKNEDGTPANAEVRTFGNHLDGSNFKF